VNGFRPMSDPAADALFDQSLRKFYRDLRDALISEPNIPLPRLDPSDLARFWDRVMVDARFVSDTIIKAETISCAPPCLSPSSFKTDDESSIKTETISRSAPRALPSEPMLDNESSAWLGSSGFLATLSEVGEPFADFMHRMLVDSSALREARRAIFGRTRMSAYWISKGITRPEPIARLLDIAGRCELPLDRLVGNHTPIRSAFRVETTQLSLLLTGLDPSHVGRTVEFGLMHTPIEVDLGGQGICEDPGARDGRLPRNVWRDVVEHHGTSERWTGRSSVVPGRLVQCHVSEPPNIDELPDFVFMVALLPRNETDSEPSPG